MYIHYLDLAKAKREAPAYTFIVYFKTIHLEPLQKKKSTTLYFRGRSIWFSKELVILEKKNTNIPGTKKF